MECVLKEYNGLQLVAQHKLEENVRLPLDGAPIIYHDYLVGITFGLGKPKTSMLKFN